MKRINYSVLFGLYIVSSWFVAVLSVQMMESSSRAVCNEQTILSKHALDIVVNELYDRLDHPVQDALILAKHPGITSMLTGEFIGECSGEKLVGCYRATIAKTEQFARHFLVASKIYSKIRIINSSGQEVIKVTNKDGQIYPAKKPSRIRQATEAIDQENPKTLQYVGERYYFKDVIELDENEVYFSAFDGNVEFGKVEIPLVPVIRIATPIIQGEKRLGVVILSVSGTDVIEFLDQIAVRYPGLQVLNKDGYWLYRKDRQYLFDFMFEKSFSFNLENPIIWQRMNNGDEEIEDREKGIFFIRKFSPTQKPNSQLLQHARTVDFPWPIILRIPKEEVESWGKTERHFILGLTIILEIVLFIGCLLYFRWLQRQQREKEESIAVKHILTSRLAISSLMEIALQPLELEEMLHKGLEVILNLPWLSVEKKGAIFLADNLGQKLTMATSINLSHEILEACGIIPFGKCLCGRAAIQKATIHVKSVDEKHEISFPGMQPHGHYCIPIISREILLGVLNIYTSHNQNESAEDKEFLGTAANALASIIERNYLEKEQEKDRLASQSISKAELLIFQPIALSDKLEQIMDMILVHPWLEKITGCLIYIQSRKSTNHRAFQKNRHGHDKCQCLGTQGDHAICLNKMRSDYSKNVGVDESVCYAGKRHQKFGLFLSSSIDAMLCLEMEPLNGDIHQPIDDKMYQSMHNIVMILSRIFSYEHYQEQVIKFKRTVDQTTASVVITDIAGTIEYVNEMFTKVSGYTSEEALGNSTRILKSGQTPPAVYQEMWKNLLAGQPWSGELCNRRKNGSLFWESALISPLINQDGEITHFVAIKENITDKKKDQEERKLLEQQLRQAQKMEALGHLTGGIAHDFNNILAAIKGFSELALVRYAKDENSKLYKYLLNILNASDRARDLIAQMMSFSRTREQEMQRVILSPVIKEVIKLVRATLPSSISITLTMEAPDSAILADPVQFHQIMMNLFVNARDAMEGKGRVDVRVRIETQGEILGCTSCCTHFYSAGLLVVSLTDDGPGIPEDIQQKIFQPFFTTKEVGKGTGMGLSVIHGIVHAFQGHIVLVSQPGAGATFHLYFPLCEEAAETKSQTVHSINKPHDSLAGQVLVVDDEVAILEFLKDILEDEGLSVITKSSSSEALAWFAADPFRVDMVITDQTMPELSGTAMIQKMKALRPQLPVMLCTGFSRDVNAENAASLGVDYFLTKPINTSEMLKILRSIINNNQ